MHQDIVEVARSRHATKAFDPERELSPEEHARVRELLRLAPSSVNSQPWHFLLASTPEGRQRVARAATGVYQFNQANLLAAPLVVVFASRRELDEAYLRKVLDQEEADGRFREDPSFRETYHGKRSGFVRLHAEDLHDLPHWAEKQLYLNLGAFLLGVAALGLDAVPMEGIATEVLDAEFGLREQGLASQVVVAVGHHHPEEDFNARLPKSRLPLSELVTEL